MTGRAYGTPEPSTDWRAQAVCRDYDSELFFPLPTDKRGNGEAKEVCRRCPVSDACLEEALRGRSRYGVWGGLTELEREALIRKRSRAAK